MGGVRMREVVEIILGEAEAGMFIGSFSLIGEKHL
jgi:hypothetical protein